MKETDKSNTETPVADYVSGDDAEILRDHVASAMEDLLTEQSQKLELAEKYSAEDDWDQFKFT